MSTDDMRPWLRSYGAGLPSDIVVAHPSMTAMWADTVAHHRDAPFLRYFDTTTSVGDVDKVSDAVAAGLADRGVGPGDRVALYLQNVPAFVHCLLATWKAGGIAVPINPMNTTRELQVLLSDSGATVLVCHPDLWIAWAAGAVADTPVRTVVCAPETDGQTRNDPRLFHAPARVVPEGTVDLAQLVEDFRGRRVADPGLGPDDVALLTYTSGTTGPPKGAMLTHGNVLFNAQTYREWAGLGPDDVVLGVAPLFHVTGLVAHIALAMLVPTPLVLAYRFHPEVVLDAIRESRPTFTVGSITVFIALMHAPGAAREDFASLRTVYSGGAPVPPSVAEEFEARLGPYIHNIYGLTETTSPSHAVPRGTRAPVAADWGALSVGVPVFNTAARVVGDDGADLPPGEVGELVISGPQVVPGYWGKPAETAATIGGGWLRTGDVGFMDDDGWFYVVDRKKDLINVSGFKVWPREVEDVLYQHPAVREVAVVGVPDPYRGETVKAVISVRPGTSVDTQELIEHCRKRMAAYKYPRLVEIVDELPKTASGKILRRELRTPA
jgi:long-chain acyl-CoA synthetase